MRIEAVDGSENFNQQLALVGREPVGDGLSSVPEIPKRGFLDAPPRLKAFEEFEYTRPAEDVQISACILGGKRRVAVLQKRCGPQIDSLSANNGRTDVTSGNDPVIVGIRGIAQKRTPPIVTKRGRSAFAVSIPISARFSCKASWPWPESASCATRARLSVWKAFA